MAITTDSAQLLMNPDTLKTPKRALSFGYVNPCWSRGLTRINCQSLREIWILHQLFTVCGLFLILHPDFFHFLNLRDHDCMSSGSLKHNPARPHVLADKRHEYLPLVRIGHLGRDREIQPVIFGQNNQRRAYPGVLFPRSWAS